MARRFGAIERSGDGGIAAISKVRSDGTVCEHSPAAVGPAEDGETGFADMPTACGTG